MTLFKQFSLRGLFALLILLICMQLPVFAQDRQIGSHQGPLATIGFRPLILFRATVFGIPPNERARIVEDRINTLLQQGVYSPIEAKQRAEGVAIFIGNEFVLLVTADDVDHIADDTVDEVVARTINTLKLHVEGLKEMHDPKFLTRAAGKTMGSFLALLALAAVLFKLRRSFGLLFERWEEKLLGHLQIGGFRFLEHLLVLTRSLFKLGFWSGLIIPIYLWIAYGLSQFPVTLWWGERLTGLALEMLKDFSIAVLQSIPDLLMVVILIIFAQILARLIRSFFQGVIEGRVVLSWIDADTAAPIEKIVLVVLYMFALVMIYPYLPGSSSDAFKGISLMAGVILSLGSASAFSQIMAGLTLMFSKTFKVGDYVQIGEAEGVVHSLGYLATKIRNGRNEEISLPNTLLLSHSTKNFSSLKITHGVPLCTRVSIGYGDPWRTIHQLLIDSAAKCQGLKPDSKVYQIELGDFYIIYELQTYLDGRVARREVLTNLHQNILDAFNDAGIQIMSPHYEGDPAEKIIVKAATKV